MDFNFTDISSLLNFLVYGGVVVLIASWLLDKIPGFVALQSEAKKWINMVLSVVLALGAYAAILYVPAEYFALIDPLVQDCAVHRGDLLRAAGRP